VQIEIFNSLKQQLVSLLSPEQVDWLYASFDKLEASDDLVNTLLTLSAITRRKLGEQSIENKEAGLKTSATFIPISHWTCAEAGRGLLILKALSLANEQTVSIIQQYFEQGDEKEVTAICRVLMLLDQTELLKPFALEVGRTNSKSLFLSLIQYNPFPQACYTDHEFNQLVLKALFLGLEIGTVFGLRERANKELSQMCEDYIRERLAAKRSIPVDIRLALEPYASEYGEEMIYRYMSDEDYQHRYYSIFALLQNKPISKIRKIKLNERLSVEDDKKILQLLSTMELTKQE